MGVSALTQHQDKKKHKEIEEEKMKNETMKSFVRNKSVLGTIDMQVAAAEGTWAYHVAKHHQSFASTDCASSLFKVLFPASDVAKKYGCAQDKTAAIIKGVNSIVAKRDFNY
uniref:Uncharacterized protein n=1 Tax=Meloidogyne enterolobii TaxID=390850 RepID=A0A6V7XEF7_MELEN|nr:unnamed protein product [Meloidogyne enterolobii]